MAPPGLLCPFAYRGTNSFQALRMVLTVSLSTSTCRGWWIGVIETLMGSSPHLRKVVQMTALERVAKMFEQPNATWYPCFACCCYTTCCGAVTSSTYVVPVFFIFLFLTQMFNGHTNVVLITEGLTRSRLRLLLCNWM